MEDIGVDESVTLKWLLKELDVIMYRDKWQALVKMVMNLRVP
jgi:hypothetical protein